MKPYWKRYSPIKIQIFPRAKSFVRLHLRADPSRFASGCIVFLALASRFHKLLFGKSPRFLWGFFTYADYVSSTEIPKVTTTQAIKDAQMTIAIETARVTFSGFTPAATEAAAAN
jgi:hypothetical protein